MLERYEKVLKYRQFYEITRDMICDEPPTPDQNPFDFIRQFDEWFQWEERVHFDGDDPVLMNIAIFGNRKLEKWSWDFFTRGANASGVLQVPAVVNQ